MIRLEDIIDAYFVTRQNKRRSADQVEFELHWQSGCMQLYRDIVDRCFQPKAYMFVVKRPKVREVFASDMQTRILHHYLDMRMRPIMEKLMSPHIFNNRKGKGQKAFQNALIEDIYRETAGYTRDAWIIKLDLKACFPNINLDIAFGQMERLLTDHYEGEDKDELLYILRICVYSFPTLHCEVRATPAEVRLIPEGKSVFKKPIGIGASLGFLLWQNAVNWYFQDVCAWMESMEVAYERYVDDWIIVTRNKAVTLAYVIPELRRRFARLGARLNESKFYCQHASKGVEALGVHIKMDRVYPNRRLQGRAAMKIREFNRHIDEQSAWELISSVNSYLGLMKTTNGYKTASAMLGNLDGRWYEHIRYDGQRVCIRSAISRRNYIINKYKLREHDTDREGGELAEAQRTAV